MHAEDRPGWLEHESERPWPHGMDHALQDLDVLLREAHATGRLALLPALDLDRKHNFGTWHDWQWNSYFDPGASRLIDAAGNVHPCPTRAGARPRPNSDRGLRRADPGVGDPPGVLYSYVPGRGGKHVSIATENCSLFPIEDCSLRACGHPAALLWRRSEPGCSRF